MKAFAKHRCAVFLVTSQSYCAVYARYVAICCYSQLQKLSLNIQHWSCGPMDKASDYESGDCRFESCQDQIFCQTFQNQKSTRFIVLSTTDIVTILCLACCWIKCLKRKLVSYRTLYTLDSLRGAIGQRVRLLTERLVVRAHPGANVLFCEKLFGTIRSLFN